MLEEPGLLQGLVNLTCADDGETAKHALLAVMHLATQASRSHHALFFQLLPAIPLDLLVTSPSAEICHACARLIFLLARPSSEPLRPLQPLQPLQSALVESIEVPPWLRGLLDAAARPLIRLLDSPWRAVRSTAVQAVGRLTQATGTPATGYARRLILDSSRGRYTPVT